ncbi:MAG: response regulator [Pseudomonadota bacterium]
MDGLKLLCVEDDPVDVRTLLEIINEFGWTATFATNGLDGYAFAQTERFDVIVSDQNMEDLTGLGLFKCVRSGNGPNSQTPFVLNSWSFTPEIIRSAEEMQVDALVAKPLLKMHVKQHLNSLVGPAPAANQTSKPTGPCDCQILKRVPLIQKFFA